MILSPLHHVPFPFLLKDLENYSFPRLPGSHRIRRQRFIVLWGIFIHLVCLSSFGFLGGPSLTFANTPDFEDVLANLSGNIDQVTDDSQAESYIRSTIQSALPTSQNFFSRRKTRNSLALPESISKKFHQLATQIAVWKFAKNQEALVTSASNRHEADPSPDSPKHLKWLTQKVHTPLFHRVLALSQSYQDLSQSKGPSQLDFTHYGRYTQFLQEQYPDWPLDPHTVIALIEKEGGQGVRRRLEEFWQTEAIQSLSSAAKFQETYGPYYLHHFYLPIHKALFERELLQLQVSAEREGRRLWNDIYDWYREQQQHKHLMRLCGTWQWLIHNHQNHGDHKTVMTYPPPSQYDRMDPKPATIHIQGDTVYIRWEFPRGIVQEESLLLTERDRLLTGTFRNSVGPYGNITGRRIKPCQKK